MTDPKPETKSPEAFLWLQSDNPGIEGPFVFDFEDPDFLSISDISFSRKLGARARWSGAENYRGDVISVAKHAITVSALAMRMTPLRDPSTRALVGLKALHHDDSEAFPPFDLPSPLKRWLDCPKIKELEDRVQSRILSDIFGIRRLSLTPEQDYLVSRADFLAGYAEALTIFGFSQKVRDAFRVNPDDEMFLLETFPVLPEIDVHLEEVSNFHFLRINPEAARPGAKGLENERDNLFFHRRPPTSDYWPTRYLELHRVLVSQAGTALETV